MTIRTFKLADGKYEVDRDENGLMIACRRNGTDWLYVLEKIQYINVVHAMLNRIEDLETQLDNTRCYPN